MDDYINIEFNEYIVNELSSKFKNTLPLVSEGGKRKIIEKILERLSEEEIRIIYLYFYEGYSHRECAKIVGINKRNFKKRIKRIINKMRKIYEEEIKNGDKVCENL